MSYKLKVVNAGVKSDKDAAIEYNKIDSSTVKPSDTHWVTKEHLNTEQENLNKILHRKFDKEELLERFSQVIDKANEFIDKEDVQKVRKLFINAGTDKASQQVAATEAMGLHDKYCTFEDTLTQTALMMAVTGNTLI